jgi:hypothetical protein
LSELSPGHRPKKGRAAKKRNTGTNSRKPRKATAADPSKTGRALRQTFPTPDWNNLLATTIAEVSALNGPEATGKDTEHALFRRHDTKFDDKHVRAVFDAVRHSKVPEMIEGLIDEVKIKPGRPAKVNYRALVVAMLLTAIDGKGCLCTEIARTLYHRLRPSSMRLLGIEPMPAALNRTTARRQKWQAEKRTRDALRRFLSAIDPSIHPKGKEMPYVALRALDRPLTDEEIAERQRNLVLVCNRILRTPFELLPAKVRRKYRGSACVDATPMRVHSTLRSVSKETAPSDPDAGVYSRQGDHTEDAEKDWSKVYTAYDINLTVAVCDYLGDRQYLPALPLAAHIDRPGVDPAGAFQRMAAHLVAAGHVPRYLAGDGLYARADPAAFHTPARQAGWKLVLPVLDEHLGIQASLEGLLLVEGELYCPSMPQNLIDATATYRETLATLPADRQQRAAVEAAARTQYQQDIANREPYRARYKDTNTSGKQRWGCPASGSHSSVVCPIKPKSGNQIFLGPLTVPSPKLKPAIVPNPATQAAGTWPKPCRQDSVSIDVHAHRPEDEKVKETSEQRAQRAVARFKQDIRFGTDEHTDTYNALRQSQEGFHGFLKDEAYEALGSPGKRRVKGLAAQSLFAAVLLAAAGVRKVRRFLDDALEDDNGDLYILRRRRKGDHAPTHLPPGTKGTRGDPDYDKASAA